MGWRKIALAAAIISEASTAVASMPLIVFFPVPIMTILLAWFGVWLWGMGNLWTMGAITSNELNKAAGISNTTISANSIKEFKESELKKLFNDYSYIFRTLGNELCSRNFYYDDLWGIC